MNVDQSRAATLMAVNPLYVKLCVPEGLEHALEGLAREVLRRQPSNIYKFAATYFHQLLQLRKQIEEDTGCNANVAQVVARGKDMDIAEDGPYHNTWDIPASLMQFVQAKEKTFHWQEIPENALVMDDTETMLSLAGNDTEEPANGIFSLSDEHNHQKLVSNLETLEKNDMESVNDSDETNILECKSNDNSETTAQNSTTQMREVENISVPEDNVIYKESTLQNDTEGDTIRENGYEDEPKLLDIISTINMTTGHINGNSTSNTFTDTSNQSLGEIAQPTPVLNVDDGPACEVKTGFREKREAIPTGMRQITSGLDMDSEQMISQLEVCQDKEVDDPMSPVGKELANNVFILAPLQENKSADNCTIPVKETLQLQDNIPNFQENINPNNSEIFQQTDPINNTQFQSSHNLEQIERSDENSEHGSTDNVLVENDDTKESENDPIKADISEICSQQNNLMQGSADVNICQQDRLKTNDAELKSAAANDVINALITDELKSHQCEESQLPQSDRNYDMVIAPGSSYEQIIPLEDKEGETLKVPNTLDPVDNETINALNNEDNLICPTRTENVPQEEFERMGLTEEPVSDTKNEEPSSTEITSNYNADEMVSDQTRTKTPELDSALPEQIQSNEYGSNDAEETNGAMLSNNADWNNQKKKAEADEAKSIQAEIETNEPLDVTPNQENQADLTDGTTCTTAENINEKQKEHSESTVQSVNSTTNELNDTETETIHSEHTDATQAPTVSNEQDPMHSTSVPNETSSNEQDGVVTADMNFPDTVSATTTEHTKETLASPTGGLPIERLDEPVSEGKSTTAFETSQTPLHKETDEIPDSSCEKEEKQSVETAENCTDTHSNDFQADDFSLTPKQPNANNNIQADNSNSEEHVNFPIEMGNGETSPIKDAECHQSNATPLDSVEDSSELQAEAINSTNSFSAEAENNCTAGVVSEPEEILSFDKENTEQSVLEETGENGDTQTDSAVINYNDDEPASLLYISEHNSNDYANAGESVATNQVISAMQQTKEHGILPVDKDELMMLVENPDVAIVKLEKEVEKQCEDVVSNPEQVTKDIAEENEIRQPRDEMEPQLLPLTEEPASISLETEQTPLRNDEHQNTVEDENSEKSKELCETLSSHLETVQQPEDTEESPVADYTEQEPILGEEDEIKPIELDEETKSMDLAEENQQLINDELKPKSLEGEEPKSQEIEETKSLVEEPQTLGEKVAMKQGNDDPKPLEDNAQKSFEQQELKELEQELTEFEQELKVLEQEPKPQEDEEHVQANAPNSMEGKDPKPLKEEPESLEENEPIEQENDDPKTLEHNAQKSFEQQELKILEQEQRGLEKEQKDLEQELKVLEPKVQEVDEPHQEDTVQKSFEQQELKELEQELKEFEQELKVLEQEPKAQKVDEPQQPEDNVPQSSEEMEPKPLKDNEPRPMKDDEPQLPEDIVPQSSEEKEPIPIEVENEEARPQEFQEPLQLEDNVPQLSEEKESKPQDEQPQQLEDNVPMSLEEKELKPLEEPQSLEDMKPVNDEPVDNEETNLLENEKPHDLEGNETKPLEEEQKLQKESESSTLGPAEESEVKKNHNADNEAELKSLDDVKPIQLPIAEEPTVEKSEELESLLENEPMPFEVEESETAEHEIFTEYEEPKLLEDIMKPNVANGEGQSVLPLGDENSTQLDSTEQTPQNHETDNFEQITSNNEFSKDPSLSETADDTLKCTDETMEHTDVTNGPDKSAVSVNTEGSGMHNDEVTEKLHEVLDVPEITEINSGNNASEDNYNKSLEQQELKALEQELKEFEQELKVLELRQKPGENEEQDPLEDNVPKSTEENSDDSLHKTEEEQSYEVYPQNTKEESSEKTIIDQTPTLFDSGTNINEEFPAQEETIQPEIYQPAVNSKYAGLFPENILEENHENMSEKYSAANATDNPKIQVDFARDSGCNTPGNDPTSLIDNQIECKIPFADSSQDTVIDEQELSDIASNLTSEPTQNTPFQILDLQAISDSFPREQIHNEGISLSADSNKDEEQHVAKGLQLTIPDADSATFEADSLETNDSGRGAELLSIAPDDSLVELELNSEDVIRNNKLVQTDLIGKI